MLDKPKNIIEDLAQDCLKGALSNRADICTCATCHRDMLAYVLCRVPPKYVTTEKGALHTVIDQTKVENEAELGRAVLDAINLISKHPRHDSPDDSDEVFDMLLNKIFEDRRLDFRHYRKELLKRRIAIRIRVNNLKTISDYLRLLLHKPEEYDKLFETLCINVSEFYRDPGIWVTIRCLFERAIEAKKAKKDNTLRIWSAGCANGEEPYSIAILIKELIKNGKTGNIVFQIYATDVDKKCLKIADKAEYNKESIKNAPNTEEYFTSSGNVYRVKDEIKNMVEFKNLDLIGQNGIESVDVIFCRNVFIYFNRSLQEQLLMKFFKSLKPGGYLIKGQSETLISEALHIFEEVDDNARIYRKINLPSV